jgi:predicted dehydrogenase
VAEAFMYRHHPQLATVRELVRAAETGELVAMHARLHFSLPRSGEPDIRLRPDLGGGSLLDLGCYPVDLFGGLMGTDPDEVAAVSHREDEGGVDTRTAAVLRYGDVVATMDCSFDSPMLNTATLIGTEGTITVTDPFRTDRVGGVGTVLVGTGGQTRRIQVAGDHYAEQVRAFTQALTDRRTGEGDVELTRRTVRTLERIAQAAGVA